MVSIKALDAVTPADPWREVPLQPEADPPPPKADVLWRLAEKPSEFCQIVQGHKSAGVVYLLHDHKMTGVVCEPRSPQPANHEPVTDIDRS